jgi:alkyl hydroperoxide reductase subunit AhpC
MSKFGTLLNSRPTGKEESLRLVQIINGSAEKQPIILDFSGVEILTPSYADELLHFLWNKYGKENIKIENIQTPVVEDAIKVIE